MLELRQKFRERNAVIRNPDQDEGSPSLPAMVLAFYRARRHGDPGSILNYAQQIDGILRRWNEWSGHFQRISGLPRWRSQGLSRSEYAAENLRRENGEGFSKSSLNGIMRWGLWLWENRHRLGLSRGTTIAPPPPPTDGE
jgi:hypothetical protein